MANQSPRDFREWQRNIERLAKGGNRAARALVEKSPGGTPEGIEAIIEANKKLTPAAPVELVVQTAIAMGNDLRQRGVINLSFPEVTKAATGQDLLVDKYELWGQDITASALNDTTAPYPDITAPGLSFPGQGFHVNPVNPPSWKLLATSPNPDLTVVNLDLNSRWMIRARAIGSFTVAPGLWSEQREVQVLPDTTPPPQPTKPILTVNLGTIAVRWDAMSVSGPMPADFLKLYVAQGEAPAPEAIVAELDRINNLFIIPDATPYQPQFFRFRAEDMSGNLSPWSEADVAVTTPLVDTSEMEEVLRRARAELAAAKAELEAELGALQEEVVDVSGAVTIIDGKADDALAAAGDANTAAGAAQTAAEDAAKRARELGLILTNRLANPEFELDFEGWYPFPADKWTIGNLGTFRKVANGTSPQGQEITLTADTAFEGGPQEGLPNFKGITLMVAGPGTWRFKTEGNMPPGALAKLSYTTDLVNYTTEAAPIELDLGTGFSVGEATLHVPAPGYLICEISYTSLFGSGNVNVFSASLVDITELTAVGDLANDALDMANSKGKTFIQSTAPLGIGKSYKWTGTPHASASQEVDETGTVLGVNLTTNPSAEVSTAGWSGNLATLTQDTAWAASGTKSFKVTPLGTGVPSDMRAGSPVLFPFGMQPGKTYSIQATMRLAAPQVGGSDGRARAIMMGYSLNGSSYTISYSPKGPNVAGQATVAAMLTVPANATGVVLILGAGSNNPADAIWWDAVSVVESSVPVGYFDGDTASSTVGFSNSLWIDTTLIGGVPGNTPKKWNGTAWVEVTDKAAKDAAQAAVDAKNAADAAAIDATEALRLAGLAQDSADGKNNVYYDEPLGTGALVKGDTWFDRPNGLIKVWSGTAWVEPQLGTNAFKDLAITNAKILNLDGGKITAQTITGVSVAAQTITVDKLLVGSTDNFINESDFTNAGASWDLSATRQIIAGQARNGGPVYRLTGIAGVNSAYNKPGARPMTGATVWRFVAWVRSSVNVAADTYTFFSRVRNAAGAFSYPAIAPVTPALVANVWTKVTGVISAPDTSVDYTFALSLRATFPTGAHLDIDSVSATRMGDGSLIVDGAVTADSIAANAITAVKIMANAITTEKINAEAIVAGKIAVDAVTAGTIAANAVTTAKLDALAVTADKIAANTITADKINVGSITAAILTANSITTEMLQADAITAKHTITGATIQTSANANEGIKISALGIQGWDSFGVKTVDITGSPDGNLITGNYRSNIAGQAGVLIFNQTTNNRPGIWLSSNGSAGGEETAILLSGNGALNLRSREGYNVTAQTAKFSVIKRASESETEAPFTVWTGAVGAASTIYIGFNATDETYLTGKVSVTNNLEISSAGSLYVGGTATIANIIHQNAPTATFAANVGIASTPAGKYYKVSSARRFKYAIDTVSEADRILDVEPRSWFDAGATDSYVEYVEGGDIDLDQIPQLTRIPGVVAEEVEAAGLGMYCTYGEDGVIEGVSYDRLWTLLIPIVKQLRGDVAELSAKIATLEGGVTS